MVHSPMYQRLMRFVEDAKANEALADYDSKHRSTLEAMREAEEYIRHFREHQGFQGQTGDAIDNWLERAERRLERWRSSYLATTQVEVEMRRVMQQAREEAEMLSPVLVDARLDKLRDVAEVTIPVMEQYGLVGKAFNAVASTGAAVYDAIAAQANNEREVSSTAILERLNHSMDALAAHASLINQAQQHLAEAGTRDSQVTIPQGPSTPVSRTSSNRATKGSHCMIPACIRATETPTTVDRTGAAPIQDSTRMALTTRPRRTRTPRNCASSSPGAFQTASTARASRAAGASPSPIPRT